MVRNTGMTLRCTASGTASGGIGTRNAVTMFTPLDTTGTTTLTIPITENWVLTDLYVVATGDYGTGQPFVEFTKDRGITMGTSASLISLLVTNNTRPRFLPEPVGFEAGTVMQMTTVMTVANDATIDPYIFYVAVSIQ